MPPSLAGGCCVFSESKVEWKQELGKQTIMAVIVKNLNRLTVERIKNSQIRSSALGFEKEMKIEKVPIQMLNTECLTSRSPALA